MGEHSVLKFGGTSVANPELIAEIFAENPEKNRIAVVSAIGKDYGDTNGNPKITDKLLDLETAIGSNDQVGVNEAVDFVIERTKQVYASLGSAVLNKSADYIRNLLNSKNRSDRFAWVGEHISAKLFAELTGALYVPTDLKFSGNVLHLPDSVESVNGTLRPFLSTNRQIVTEGFFGYDRRSGRVEVLPRGGSDITGVIYTGALNVAEPGKWINENYTDKDGLFSADPDMVKEAKVIPEITHEEVREKMHGITERNGPIHGDAIAYASRLNVEMMIRNSFNRDAPGTHIVAERISDPEHPIIGVTGKSNVVALDAFDMGMADAKNYLSAILAKTGELDVSISNVPTGEDRIKLVFNSVVTDEKLELISNFILSRAISGDKATVNITRDEGAVYLVGQELTNSLTYTRTIGKVATILAEASLPMREVISHEKSPSLALTVAGGDVRTIIGLLHKEFIESQ